MDEIHGWVTIDDGRYGYGCYVHMNRNTLFFSSFLRDGITRDGIHGMECVYECVREVFIRERCLSGACGLIK